MYGAYLDVRPTNRLGPTVRVLGMINRLEPTVKTFCQLWFSDSLEPVVREGFWRTYFFKTILTMTTFAPTLL